MKYSIRLILLLGFLVPYTAIAYAQNATSASGPVVVRCASGPNKDLVVDPVVFPPGSTLPPTQVNSGAVITQSQITTSKVLQMISQGDPNFVVVVAHRGDWYSCPENTIPAFQQAINDGLEAFEADIRMAQDGTLVVSHDSNLSKEFNWNLSNGLGLISQMTWSQINGLSVRDRRGYVQTGTNIKPLTFQDVLQVLQQNSSGGKGPVLLVDIKDPNQDQGNGITGWNTYKAAVQQVQQNLDRSTQAAVLFKLNLSAIPVGTGNGDDSIQTQCATHPGVGHITAIAFDNDAKNSARGPNGSTFRSIYSLSAPNGTCGDPNNTPTSQFVQNFEVISKSINDITSNYLNLPSSGHTGPINAFGLFAPFYFYPEGWAAIWAQSNQNNTIPPQPSPSPLQIGQAFCCRRQNIAFSNSDGSANTTQDLRQLVNFPFYYQVSGGISEITTDNLPITLNWLSSVNKRQVSEIQ